MTCPNHASFRLLTVARGGSCGSTRKLILLRTQSFVLRSKRKYGEVSSCTWFRNPGSFFLFFPVSKLGPCFTAVGEDGSDKRLVQTELARKAGGASSGAVLENKSTLHFLTVLVVANVVSCVHPRPNKIGRPARRQQRLTQTPVLAVRGE